MSKKLHMTNLEEVTYVDMADSAGSGSGSSSHSENRSSLHRRSRPAPRPGWTNFEQLTGQVRVPNEETLGKVVERLQSNEQDRGTARRAVAIVLRATRKRGLKGAIALCTEVASLLEQIRRLEHVIFFQKRELRSLTGSHKSSSPSTRSSGAEKRRSESKGNQVRPLLIDRGTSPLLKEVYVKSFNDQATQTDITSLDERLKLLDHSSDRGSTTLEEVGKNEILSCEPKPEEKVLLKLQEENIGFQSELTNLRNELESLQHKVVLQSLQQKEVLPQITPDAQMVVSKAPMPLSKNIDVQSKENEVLPESTAEKQEGSVHVSREVELPQVPQAKHSGQMLNSKSKTCQHLKRRKAYRPLSSPVKVVPRQPIRPVDMYSSCKCPGCTRESGRVLCDLRHSTDKKSPKQLEILPCVGDHVVVKGHLSGVVKYIGSIVGKKQQYVGLHLDSPVGNHNGIVNGIHYFSCPHNYGKLVPVEDVLCITSSQTSKVKQSHKSTSEHQNLPGSQVSRKAQTF